MGVWQHGKLFELTAKILTERKRSKVWRRLSTVIACLVVFSTTYMLILPALTLDEVTAIEEPGIDIGYAESEGDFAEDAGGDLLVEDGDQGILAEDGASDIYTEEPAEEVDYYPEEYADGEIVDDTDEAEEAYADDADEYDDETYAEEADDTGIVIDSEPLTYENDYVRITASFDDTVYTAPEGISLGVTPFEYGTGVFEAYDAAAGSKLSEQGNYVINGSAYYDMWFEVDGEVVNPAPEARIEIQYKDKAIIEAGSKLYSLLYDNVEIMIGDQVECGLYGDDDPTWAWRSTISFNTYGSSDVGHRVIGILSTDEVPEAEEQAEDEVSVESGDEEALVADAADGVETEVETDEEFIDEAADETFEEEDSDITEEVDALDDDESKLSEDASEDESKEESVGNTDDEEKEEIIDIDEENFEEEYKNGTFRVREKDYIVEVTLGSDAKIPVDAVLSVSEIDPESDEYQEYYEQAVGAITDDSMRQAGFARFFDISFMIDGEEVEPDPKATVDVKISFNKTVDQQNEEHTDETGEVSAVHFTNEGVENIEVEAAGEAGQVREIVFEASSFSVYGFVYTVDFEYSVNGKMYQFSLPGGGYMTLHQLVEVLGIIENTSFESVDEFVRHIDNVEFSDPELVRVALVDGDWTLESLQAFSTEETLTITMKNGDVVTVRVTDSQDGYADMKSAATQGLSFSVVDQGSSTATYNAGTDSYNMQLKVDFHIPHDDIVGTSGTMGVKKYCLEFSSEMKIPDEYLNRDMSGYDSVTGEESYKCRLVKNDDHYEMLIEFTDDYIRSITESGRTIGNNTQTIDISVGTDWLQVDDSLKGHVTNDKEITVTPDKITYPEGTDGKHDISVSKQFGGYDKTTHKMKYTMVVSSSKGTAGPITVEDGLAVLGGSDITVSNLTVTSVKTGVGNEYYLDNVNTPVSNYTATPSSDNTHLTLTLPQATVAQNQSGKTVYLIEYEYELSGVGDDFESNGKNSVTASSGSVSKDGEASWSISQAGVALDKSGQYNTENGAITWTINVTNNKDSAIPLQDDALMGLNYADLSITPSDTLTFDGTTGTLIIPAGKSYTITYTTRPMIADPTKDTTVTNRATADTKTVEPSVTVPKEASANKELVSVARGESSAVLSWRVRIHVPQSGFAAGTTFTEKLSFNQDYLDNSDMAAFTDAQKEALVDAFKGVFGNAIALESYTPSGKVATDEYGNYRIDKAELVMKLNTDWADSAYIGKDIFIEYQTSADLSQLHSDNNGYDNTFLLNDIPSTATYSFKDRVVKMASPGNAADVTTASADSDNKKLHWYIQVALEQDTTSVTVTDTLPEGLKVTAIRMGDGPYNLIGLVETSEGVWGGETYTDWRNVVPAWSSTYLSGSTAYATVSGQTVTISLSADQAPDYLKQNEVFYFYIEAEIDDSEFPATGTTVKSYENTASVTVNGNPYASDDQTQNVTLKTSIVDKTGDSSVWNAQNGAHELSYAVDINPAGGTIAGADGEITLIDHIEYYKTGKDNQGNSHNVSLNLKEGSAKLQRKDSNGQWVDIPATEGWGFILNENAASPSDNIKVKEIEVFGIPDNTHLRFVYTYNVVVDGLPRNASVNLGAIKNTATLHAIVEESSSHTESKDWKNIQSSGITESTGSLTIVKVQDGNYAISLPDTYFVLEVYDETAPTKWRAVNAIGSNIQGTGDYSSLKVYRTNANGKLIISSDPRDLGTDGNFQYDTLYRVREYEPHDGYTLDGLNPEAVYFYFGHNVTPENRATMLAGFNYSGGSTHADDLLLEADTVYMTNQRIVDTITGRKQWNSTTLWPNDVIQITLELQKNGVAVEKPSSYSVEHDGQWYTTDDTGFTKPWTNPQVLTADNPQAMWESLDIDASATNAFEGYRIVETGIRYGEPGPGTDLIRESLGNDQYQWKVGNDGEVLFETFGGKVTNGMGTIVNMSKTKLDVEKSWGTQQLGNDSQIEVTMTLQKEERLYAQNGVIESTLANWQGNFEPVADMAPIVLDGQTDGIETAQWQASFKDLDRFRYDEATGRLYEIRYSVKETVKENGRDITDRYLATLEYSNDNSKVTVTNAPNVGKLAVVKEWQRRTPEAGETLPDLPEAIYISLERYYVDGSGIRHNDTEFNADHRSIRVTEADTWQKDSSTSYTWAKLFENLQRQVEVNGVKYDYKYVVKEDNVPGFTKVIEGDDTTLYDGTTNQVAQVTVTNVENETQYVPELIDIHLKKQFTDEAGEPQILPDGATATIRLYRYITVERGYYDMITKALTPEETIARMEDISFNDAGNDADWTHVLSVANGTPTEADEVGTPDEYSWFKDEWTNLPITEIYYNNGSYVKNTYEYYLVEKSATDNSGHAFTALYISDGSKDRPITIESEGTPVANGNDIKDAEIWNVESDKTLTIRKYWYGLDYEAMPGIVFTLKRQSKNGGGGWEDVSAFGTSSNGAVTYHNEDYTMEDGTEFKGYLLNQANDWNVTFAGLEEGYRYRVEEMGYLTKKDDGTGNLVDVVVPFSGDEFLINNRYHQTDEMNYEISFAGKTFANLQSIFQQNIPQTENNYGTISIGNLPKAQDYQLGLQKRWYSFTGNGGFANITTGGPSGYYTGQLNGQGARTFIVMQVYQRPYWAFGEHAGEYAGPWIEYNDPIMFNGNEADTVSPGFPQFNGGPDWHLQINSDTSMAHYGYMKNSQGIFELVYYDYKWIEVSQIPGSDGATYRTYYDGYPDEPEKHSDAPDYYVVHARQEIENYETGLLKLIKDWKLATNNKANKIFFTVVDDRGNDIAKKVYQSKYKEHYGLEANDVAYIPELGKYVFVLDASDNVSDNRWELMIKGLDVVQDVDPTTHQGFGEVTYTVEEVGCENQDGTVSAASDANYPYTASYYTKVRANGEQYAGNTAVGSEDGSALSASGLQLDSGTAYNKSGSLTSVRVVNSDEPTTELTVQKKWPGNAYPGSSVKVVLNLEQRRQKTDENNEPLWQDEGHTVPQWNGDWTAAEGTNRVSVVLPLAGYSGENAWTYTWKGLPIFKVTGNSGAENETHDILWYRVVESSAPSWTSSTLAVSGGTNVIASGDDASGTGNKTNPIAQTLTNTIDNTDIHIEKQWTNLYAADDDKSETWNDDHIVNWPEGYAIDYKVVRHAWIVSATETAATTVDYPAGSDPASYEQKNMSYTDGFEVEDWKKDPFLTGQLSSANISFDLTNQPKGAIITTDDNPPTGLAKNTTYLVEYVYEVVETAITTPYGTQDVNLPVIPTEGDKVDGVVLGDATIVNDLTNIEVEKLWTLNGESYTPEGGESVTVQLYRSKERPEGAIPVTPGKITIYVDPMDDQGRKDMADGEIVVTVTGDNGYSGDYTLSGPDFIVQTADLPDIATATGSDITYTVTVKSVDGAVIESATVNGDGSAMVGGAVTLTARAVTPPQTFKLTFNPNWVIENVWQDGATPPTDESAFANLTLTGDGTRTIRLDNSNQWGKTLNLDLRVADDSGDPITYRVAFNNNNDNKNPAFVNEIQNITPNSFSADDAANGTVTVAYKGIEKQQGGSGDEGKETSVTINLVAYQYNGSNSWEQDFSFQMGSLHNSGWSYQVSTKTFNKSDLTSITIEHVPAGQNYEIPIDKNSVGSFSYQIIQGSQTKSGSSSPISFTATEDPVIINITVGNGSIPNETITTTNASANSTKRTMNAARMNVAKAPILRAAAPAKSVTVLGQGDLTPIDAVAVGDPITLSGETWSHQWDNLPRVDENGDPIYYYVRELSASIPGDADYKGTTYTYSKHSDEDAREGYSKVTITNKLERDEPQEGRLVVTKSLSKANTSGGSLTFYVGLFTDSAGTTLAAEADVGGTNPQTITVANNATSGTVTFEPLAIGTTYYVFETNASGAKVSAEDQVSGYTIAAADVSGKSVVIAAGENTAEITNVYEAAGDAVVQVGKILNGRNLEAEEFSFTLSAQTSGAPLKDADGNDIAAADLTVKNGAAKDGEASEPVTFPTLHYAYADAGKTYIYKIEETIDSDATPGVTKDTTNGPETIYAKVVVGADNGDGTLADATVTYWKDAACTQALDAPNFINTYEESVTDINILKVKDDGTTGLDGVTFTLTKTAGDAQTFTNQTTADGGAAKFEGLKAGSYTLTETAPEGYDGIDGDITFTLTEADGVFTIARTDETADVTLDDTTFTITVKNHELTDIEVTKEWKNPEGGDHTSQEGDTITFTLYSKTGETTATVAEGLAVTYKADGSYAWTGTALGDLTAGDTAEKWGTTFITGLPKYADDGTTPIEYYVLETATSEQGVNIETTYRVGSGTAGANTAATVTNDTDPIVIVNQDVDASTSIRIIKVDAQNNETKLSDATFSLQRVKDADGADVEEEAVTQTTNGDGEATFGNLEGGTYVLTETQSPAGYETSFGSATFTVSRQGNTMVVTYTDGTNGVVTYDSTNQEFTVTNDAIVDIDATKSWKQSDGETDLNETLVNAEVTFTLWRKVGDGEWAEASDIDGYQVTLKVEGTADADAWKTGWTGLPKYDGDALITYKVVESDAKVGGAAIELPATPEAEAANYGTVDGHNNPTAEVGLTNTLPKITVEGTKTWEIAGDVPADPTLVLTRLSAKTGATEETVRNADDTAGLQPTWSGEGNTRSYSYEDLPKYDAEGYEYTYTVKEISFSYDGVEYVINNDGTVSKVTADEATGDRTTELAAYWTMSQEGNAITNTLAPVSLNVVKVKKGDVATKLPDAEFQLTRKNSSGAYEVFENAQFALNSDTNKQTGSFSVGTSGEITITDMLPGDYKLKETKAPNGYIIATGDIEFTINVDGTVAVTGRTESDGMITYSETNNMVTFTQKTDSTAAMVTIENEPGVALPSTGGPGTNLLYLLGSMLVMLAGAGFILLQRKKRVE